MYFIPKTNHIRCEKFLWLLFFDKKFLIYLDKLLDMNVTCDEIVLYNVLEILLYNLCNQSTYIKLPSRSIINLEVRKYLFDNFVLVEPYYCNYSKVNDQITYTLSSGNFLDMNYWNTSISYIIYDIFFLR